MNLGSSSKSADEANFDKMKAAYDACLDESSIAKLGLNPLLEILDKIRALYSKQSDDSGLSKTIISLAKLGVSGLVTAYTGADDRDPDTVVVSISPPYRIGLPAKERYEDKKIVEKYTKVLADVLPAICPDCGISSSEVTSLVDFETLLAAASPSSEDRQDVTVRFNFLNRLREN
jgi:endothelin-converting enzyme